MTTTEIEDQNRRLQFSLTTVMDGRMFPFIEDENANLTGYGHQNKTAFAFAVRDYDEACNGGPIPADYDLWDADSIGHRWAVLNEDGESFVAVSEGTPGAAPITTLWGAR